MNDKMEQMKQDAEEMNKAADEALKIEKDLNVKPDKVSKGLKAIALAILAFISSVLIVRKVNEWRDKRKEKKAAKARELTPEEDQTIKRAAIEAERKAAKENPEAYETYENDEYEPVK